MLSAFKTRWDNGVRNGMISASEIKRGGGDLPFIHDYTKLDHAGQAWVRDHLDSSGRARVMRALHKKDSSPKDTLTLPFSAAGIDRAAPKSPGTVRRAGAVAWLYTYPNRWGSARIQHTGRYDVVFDRTAFRVTLRLRLQHEHSLQHQAEALKERVHAAVELVWDNAIDLGFNGTRYPLRINVEFVDTECHGTVEMRPGHNLMTSWDPEAGYLSLAHELGHWFGLRDEYYGPREIDDDGIMGWFFDDDPPRVKPRYARMFARNIGRALSIRLTGHVFDRE